MTPQSPAGSHVPVLVSEVVALLAPRAGGLYVDGTFGAGGTSTALLTAAPCQVVGLDRDPVAIGAGDAVIERFPGRLTLIEGCFGTLEMLLAARGVTAVDGVALDLGVSSMQLDEAARGFSFQADGPLDMRMGRAGLSAAEIVNTCPQADLADILRTLGEERLAGRVARAIVAARPVTRTEGLAAVVRRVVPRSRDGIDPATRTFQALRLFVNDEMGELDRVLVASERVLAPGGRLVVIAFHSLEDRVVKHFLRGHGGEPPQVSRHRPEIPGARTPTFGVLTRRAVRPGRAELAANPRAWSARLRAAERTFAPAWCEDGNRNSNGRGVA
ncbi:MAG: 16S rRNA (cytosine1402-N4)-methyltransferase [Rhodospirillaceae bacterium]|nr:MAG: 16S rRNA (cytosine1402-N4)-methyltransferase [Rhodospirillaceae bacterium]